MTSSQSTLPRVIPVQINLDSAPPAVRRDMAYLLAQAAFKDDAAARVGRYMAIMGPNYPQRDRVTQDRIRVLNDYLGARHVRNNGPRPRSAWWFQFKGAVHWVLMYSTIGLFVLAFAGDALGFVIRRRVEWVSLRLQPAFAT